MNIKSHLPYLAAGFLGGACITGTAIAVKRALSGYSSEEAVQLTSIRSSYMTSTMNKLFSVVLKPDASFQYYTCANGQIPSDDTYPLCIEDTNSILNDPNNKRIIEEK